MPRPEDFPPVMPVQSLELEPWGLTTDYIAQPRDEVGLRFQGRQRQPLWQVQDRHRTAFLRGSTKFTVNTSSVQVLGDPTGVRNYLAISNVSAGAEIVRIEFGDDATTESPFRLLPGETLVADSVVMQDRVYAISDTDGARIAVAQSQYDPTAI